MLRVPSLALVVLVSSCNAGVFDTRSDRSAALDANAADNDDDEDNEDRDDGDREDRDDEDRGDEDRADREDADREDRDDEDRDDEDRGDEDRADREDEDREDRDDEDREDRDDEDREDRDDEDREDDLDDGRDDATSDGDAVPAGDLGDDDAEPFTRFILAGTDAPADADACAIGCDDSCTSCHATSMGPVCGEPLGRGERCLDIGDAVIQPIDAPLVCPSSAAPCAAGLDCHVVSFGYTVSGQCLPPSDHTADEYCGADADCVDGLRCVAAGLSGGTCAP